MSDIDMTKISVSLISDNFPCDKIGSKATIYHLAWQYVVSSTDVSVAPQPNLTKLNLSLCFMDLDISLNHFD